MTKKVISLSIIIFLFFIANFVYSQENTNYGESQFNSNLNSENDCVISGNVILPKNSKYKFNDLLISYGLFIEKNINLDGSFCITDEDLQKSKNIHNQDTDINLMITKDNNYIVYLSNTIGPGDSTIEISPFTTANKLLSSLYTTMDYAHNRKIRNIAEDLAETKILANYIETKLSDDPFYLNNLKDDNTYVELLSKATKAFDKQINENNILADKKEVNIKNIKMYNQLNGRILLKVEDAGRAYYINSNNKTMYYLGRPNDAFSVMREQGVGITNFNLNKIPIALNNLFGHDSDSDGLPDLFEDAIGTDKDKADTDKDGYKDMAELKAGYNPNGVGRINIDDKFNKNQKGKIFLQVEKSGEAWYVNPNDSKRYFLGRPADAFLLMKKLGLGISNNDFDKLAADSLKKSDLVNSDDVNLKLNIPKKIYETGEPFDANIEISNISSEEGIILLEWIEIKRDDLTSYEKNYWHTKVVKKDRIEDLEAICIQKHKDHSVYDFAPYFIKEGSYVYTVAVYNCNKDCKNPYFNYPGSNLYSMETPITKLSKEISVVQGSFEQECTVDADCSSCENCKSGIEKCDYCMGACIECTGSYDCKSGFICDENEYKCVSE